MDACKAVGLPEPEYGTDGGFVWITFKRLYSDTNSYTNENHVYRLEEDGGLLFKVTTIP